MSKTAPYRRLWLPDLIICLAILVIATICFRATDLDLILIRPFFEASHGKELQWGLRYQQPWRFIFTKGTVPTLLIALGAVVYLVGGAFSARWRQFRLHALFIVLTLGLGPALVVNAILKDHWARPRPRQISQFEGRREFARILDRGISGRGKSFPCGHASAAYVFFTFYFLFRRKRKRIAAGALLGTLLWGTTVGVARMSYGAHFASDVLWAGALIFLIALILYYFILNIPWREDHPAPTKRLSRRARILITTFAICAAVGTIGGMQLAIPIYADIHAIAPPAPQGTPLRFEIDVHRCTVELVMTNLPTAAIQIDGKAHGFGWVTKKIHRDFTIIDSPTGRVARLSLIPTGYFNELEMGVKILADPDRVQVISIALQEASELDVAGAIDTTPISDITADPQTTIRLPETMMSAFTITTTDQATIYRRHRLTGPDAASENAPQNLQDTGPDLP